MRAVWSPWSKYFRGQAGYTVWWDQTVLPGERFATVIGAQLEKSSCVIVAWSALSIKSDWVRDEAEQGRRRNVLVALRLDGTSVPLGFRQIQTEDLTGWTGDPEDRRIQRVMAGVARLVPQASAAVASPPVAATAKVERRNGIATLKIVVDGRKFAPFVREQPDLDGITAARRSSDAGTFENDQDYMQFVLSKWVEPYDDLEAALLDHNKHYPHNPVSSLDELIQAVVDRAVKSYRKQYGVG
jgi:hypothetical protein